MIIILPDKLKTKVTGVSPSDSVVAPSWLSPFTAMKVRYEIDHTDHGTVVACRLPDLFAACSARKMAKRKPDIAFRVLPGSPVPKGIPTEIKQEVDVWIFPSERMRCLYPSDLKGIRVEAPTLDDFEGKPLHDADANAYVWVGEIDGNTERLKAAIEAVNSLKQDATLTIYGTGKAQNVMPAVRLARGIEHADRIVWVGHPFAAADCSEPITAVLQAGLDATPLENTLQQAGIPLNSTYKL